MAETTENKESQLKFRTIVSDVVGEIRSEEVSRSFAALSLEELVDQHIDRMTESTSQTRPPRLSRVKQVYNQLVENIEEMKEMDPEEFDARNPADEVNTPPEDS